MEGEEESEELKRPKVVDPELDLELPEIDEFGFANQVDEGETLPLSPSRAQRLNVIDPSPFFPSFPANSSQRSNALLQPEQQQDTVNPDQPLFQTEQEDVVDLHPGEFDVRLAELYQGLEEASEEVKFENPKPASSSSARPVPAPSVPVDPGLVEEATEYKLPPEFDKTNRRTYRMVRNLHRFIGPDVFNVKKLENETFEQRCGMIMLKPFYYRRITNETYRGNEDTGYREARYHLDPPTLDVDTLAEKMFHTKLRVAKQRGLVPNNTEFIFEKSPARVYVYYPTAIPTVEFDMDLKQLHDKSNEFKELGKTDKFKFSIRPPVIPANVFRDASDQKLYFLDFFVLKRAFNPKYTQPLFDNRICSLKSIREYFDMLKASAALYPKLVEFEDMFAFDARAQSKIKPLVIDLVYSKRFKLTRI